MIDTANPSGLNRLPLPAESTRHVGAEPRTNWESHTAEGAHELKFVIDDETAGTIRNWARERLQPDAYAAEPGGDGYRVSTLYLDTPEFDIFRESAVGREGKYRLRRYGSEAVVWLERKSKAGGLVRKQRASVPDGDLQRKIARPGGDTWPDESWFPQRVEELSLRPVCHVTYERFARIGSTPVGPVRLTLDSRLCGEPTSEWTVPTESLASGALLDRRNVLELKFRQSVPALFKDLIQDLRLPVGRFSKYRETVRRFRTEKSALERREESHA